MTEFFAGFRKDEPDEEDLTARNEIAYLQDITEGHLRKTGLSINDMDEDTQQALVDSINPYLAFELGQSQGMYAGMPLVVSGVGGFLITDQAGALLGAQQTTDGDVITGSISRVQAYPVPSRSLMLEPTNPGEVISTYDQSLSVVIILGNAKFHANPSDDGIFQIVHDLSNLQVAIPAVYDMETRVADMDA